MKRGFLQLHFEKFDCSGTINCGQVHPVCFRLSWEESRSWLSQIELIGRSSERHRPVSIRSHNSHHVRTKTDRKSKELSVDLHNNFMVTYRSGQACETISKDMKTFVNLKYETAWTLPRVGCPDKLSNWTRRTYCSNRFLWLDGIQSGVCQTSFKGADGQMNVSNREILKKTCSRAHTT